MNPATREKMFLAAAIFNWTVGLGLIVMPNPFLRLVFITPEIDNVTWANQFGWLVFAFGIGYFWAARDLAANIQIIRLAIIAKLGVAAIALFNATMGNVSSQIMIPAGADAIWAVLFVQAIRSAEPATGG